LSSILTALKKLENQAKNKSPVRPGQEKNQEHPPRPQRVKNQLRLNKRYLIILAVLVLAGIAGMTLNKKIRHNHRTRTAKTKIAAQRETRTKYPGHLLNKKPAVSSKVVKKSPAPQKINKSESAEKEVKAPPAPVYASRAAPLNGINNRTALPSKPVNGIHNRKVPPPKSVNGIHNQNVQPPKPAEKRTIKEESIEQRKPNVKPERFASVPVKQSGDTHIEIQAIAWSKDPKNRLAVINGLILRQGESIDNVIIVDIGKDAVVFEKNRVEWKQLFGF
jgi:hypothetical protein